MPTMSSGVIMLRLFHDVIVLPMKGRLAVKTWGAAFFKEVWGLCTSKLYSSHQVLQSLFTLTPA